MERSKYIVKILSIMFLVCTSAKASYKQEIYNAYINGNMTNWKKTLVEMEKQTDKSDAYILELINYQYGYIGWCIGTKKTQEAKDWMKKMEGNLNLLEKKKYRLSSVFAYKSAMVGFNIGINKSQAPFIGPTSVSHAKKALELDANNPLGNIQLGNVKFYTPAVFGGSKTEAIEHFRTAQQHMERSKDGIVGDWNYLSLLTIIADSYYQTKEYDKALGYLDKALKIEPRFLWVKNELYPKYKNKK